MRGWVGAPSQADPTSAAQIEEKTLAKAEMKHGGGDEKEGAFGTKDLI